MEYWDTPKMTSAPIEHAQRELVHRHVNWKRVKSRLGFYPAIARTIPLRTMWKHRDRPPYYCHYMAWRLGSFDDESPFERLEMLIRCAESLPNWEHEIKSFVNSTDFATYWSLVWQLQVAKYLSEVGTQVAWLKTAKKPAPDLVANVGGKEWYVECYSFRKSFALYLFIEELLQRLDPGLCVSYDRCLPFNLPANEHVTCFLHWTLHPFLDSGYVANAKDRARIGYPVPLRNTGDDSLRIYMEGDGEYDPSVFENKVGHPKAYLKQALTEAVAAKTGKNDLANHHPNLLAVNYLLSADYQLAATGPGGIQTGMVPLNGGDIDVLAVTAVGIDDLLSREDLKIIRCNGVEVGAAEYIGTSLYRID